MNHKGTMPPPAAHKGFVSFAFLWFNTFLYVFFKRVEFFTYLLFCRCFNKMGNDISVFGFAVENGHGMSYVREGVDLAIAFGSSI
jgi:hypothetical protein